jgi:hypothetical protein
LIGLDQVLVEKLGYLSEYYGKWHMPDTLWYSKNTTAPTNNKDNIVQYNDYDFVNSEFYFLDDADGRKNQRYLDYHVQQGQIKRSISQDGQQYDTYTGFPYTPIQLDARARKQSPVRRL